MNLPTLYRKLLRDVVAEKLGRLESFAGPDGVPHVYVMRGPVLRRDLLPAVRIYTLNDVRTNRSEGHDISVFDGVLTLRIQIIVEDNPTDPRVADRLDWLCWLAETALLSDPAVRRDLKFITAIDTSIDLDVQGEMRTATATMDYSVRYADCFELVLVDQLRQLHFRLDFIDPPADPKTGPPGTPPNVEGGYPGGYPGPDGRTEYVFEANYEEDDAGDDTAARSTAKDA